MMETDEATDLEQLQARKLSDARHALRTFEEGWEAYRHALDLHAQRLKEHARKAADFAASKKDYDAFLEKMQARKKLAADLEPDLVDLLRQYSEPSPEIHSVERQTIVLPRKQGTAIAFEAEAVPTEGLGRGLRDRLLGLVPRANRFLYAYRIDYTRAYRIRDDAACAEALATFICRRAEIALAESVPNDEKPLFPIGWMPPLPHIFEELLLELRASRDAEQGTIESNNAGETKDTLSRNEALRGNLERDLAGNILRMVNTLFFPKFVDRVPVLPRIIVPVPVDPGPVPEEPEQPRLMPGTTRLWEELPWEAHFARLKVGQEQAPGQHLLLGYEPMTAEPVLISRPLLHAHAHVVGATQTGKTTAALIPLVTQLIRGSDEPAPPSHLVGPPPPILIIDLKGDFALFHTARLEAKRRGQTFHYFTTHPEKDSHVFDVIGSLSSLIPYRSDLGAFFAQAFDIFHGPGYGPGYYSKENREATVTGLDADFEQSGGRLSLEGLGEALKTTGSRKTGYDAREAQATFAPLRRPEILCRLERGPVTDPARVIHMPTVVENREVVYLWIPILRSTAGLDIARLALYSFMHAVGERYYTRGERRSFAIVDEFQEIASFNIGRLLTFSAGTGLSLIMANQSVQNLKVGNTDIRNHVTANANVRLFFSVTSGDDIEELQMLSGEKTVWTRGKQRSRGHSEGTLSGTTQTETFSDSKGQNWGDSFSKMWGQNTGFGGNAQGSTWNNSNQEGGSHGQSTGESKEAGHAQATANAKSRSRSDDLRVSFGRTETVRPGLDANDILDASLIDRACLIHSKRDAGRTLLGGRPRPIRCLYSMDAEEYGARRRTVWPPAPPSPPTPTESAQLPFPAPVKPTVDEHAKTPKEHPKRKERGLLLQTFFDEHAPPPLKEE
jgi:hypothetical protein